MIYDLADYTTGLGHIYFELASIFFWMEKQNLGVKQSYLLHFLCILTEMKKQNKNFIELKQN